MALDAKAVVDEQKELERTKKRLQAQWRERKLCVMACPEAL